MLKEPDKNNAIVLSMFGTSVEHALPGLLQIHARMTERFPQALVRMAFSSLTIRRIWWQRAGDDEYRAIHPEVPEDIFYIRSPEEVCAGLLEKGIDALVVQLVQIAPARENFCLSPEGVGTGGSGMSGAPGVKKIAIGRPALGTHGPRYPYAEDIVAVARTLAPDAVMADREKAALFYLGHGNKQDATSRVYHDFVVAMCRLYPEVITAMSLVEKGPALDEIVRELKKRNVEKLLLKPFMIVAGDHVRKDMVGGGADTLKKRLEKEGFDVVSIAEGLGENRAFADIFVEHAGDAARDAGIELR